MRKLYSVLILTLFFSIFYSKANAQGFLKANGQAIVDENGNEIIWRGIGLGGWMLQEGYMLGTGGPQHTIEARIEALVGTDKKEQFYEAWLSNHMRKIDVDSMAAWGYNMIRLPMHYKLFTPPIEEEPVPGQITWLEKGFAMTDALLEWCKANNIYLILDLHAAPGGQGENADISDYDSSKPSLWESQENRNKMIALWKKLAERYADEPNIAAYDIINEPNWGFQNHASDLNGCSESANTELWQLQKDITTAIRQVDQKHIIVIEGNCWGNNYNGLPTLWDNNIVMSYHKYWNSNNQGSIQGMLTMRAQRNVPIWLGETGENSNTWFTNAVSLFEGNKFGWSWWPLKKLGMNNPLQIKRNDDYQAILDYWGGNGAKPSAETAFAGLMQMAEDLKLENNIYHKDVVDAVIRQPHTTEIIPFKEHKITPEGQNIVYAVNYDLGREGFAYHDMVSANTTGNAGGATWNTGSSYRNDGVDIQACQDEVTNGYSVGWTENKEWLKYTVEVEKEGNYQFKLRTASGTATGKISLFVDEVRSSEVIELPNTGGFQTWETTTMDGLYLTSGTHVFKLLIENGGFNINYFQLTASSSSNNAPRLLEKKGTHSKKKIELTYNLPFEAIPADHGFSLKVNGQPATITAVNLKADVPQVILIDLEKPLYYGDEVLLTYAGEGVVTKSGAKLDPFTDEPIIIKLEGGVEPLPVPGKIEAEAFTVNSGFDTENTEDTGGGLNVGYTDNGDYMDYIVEVTKEGYYQVDYRVSSESAGGSISLKTVGTTGLTTDISEVAFNATGAWQNWTTVQGTMAHLTKGLVTLRLQATASSFNINWFKLSFISEGAPTAIDDPYVESMVKVFPNPTSGEFTIEFKAGYNPKRITVLDDAGNKVMEVAPPIDSRKVVVEKQFSTGIFLIVIEDDKQFHFKKIIIQ